MCWKALIMMCYASFIILKKAVRGCHMQRLLQLSRTNKPHNKKRRGGNQKNQIKFHSCKHIFEHLFVKNFGLHKTVVYKTCTDDRIKCELNSWSTSLTCFAKSGLLESISYLKSQKSHKSHEHKKSGDWTSSGSEYCLQCGHFHFHRGGKKGAAGERKYKQ